MDEIAKIRSFGMRLRELRKERGLSQEGFAHLVDLDRTYVGGIERGERNPGLKVIYRLAAALEIEVSELFHKTKGRGC